MHGCCRAALWLRETNCMWKNSYRVAVLTASDKGTTGQRQDESGPLLESRMREVGCEIVAAAMLPDDEAGLSAQLLAWSQSGQVDLILTTGGTGLSPRDNMPEATLAVATRLVPGMAEAMRATSMKITPRAMLSRGVVAVCQNTLIINLPGSPKAAGECLDAVMPALEHALDTLGGGGQECGQQSK